MMEEGEGRGELWSGGSILEAKRIKN